MPGALPLLALAYCLGIGIGDALALQRPAGAAAVGAALLLALLARRRGRGLGLALLGLALCVGALAQARRPAPLPLPEAQGPMLLEGQVLAGPEAGPAGTVLRLALDRLQAEPGGPWQALGPPAVLAVTVRGVPRELLCPGDRARLRAAPRPPDGVHNPGAGDPRRRAAAEGIQALASVAPEALLRLDEEAAPGPAPRRALCRLRAALLAHLAARLGEGAPAALVAALTLGDRGALSALRPPLDDTFRRAGVYHVLSVSGLHLAVVSLLSYGALLLLLRRAAPAALLRRVAARRVAALCAIPATLGYTALTGAAVATVRAAGVAVCCYGAVACGRRARLGGALAAAVLWICAPAAAPLSLFDPALQLSVAAALGTALLAPRASRPPSPDLIGRAAALGLRLAAATVGATLATAPLLLLHFGELEGAALLGNLVVVPVGELLVVPLGLLGALLSLLSPSMGGILLHFAGAAAAAMAALAEQVAGLGLSAVAPAPSGPALLLWALGLAALGWGRAAPEAPAAWGRAGLALLLLSVIAYAAPLLLPRRELRATFLDIGQGDAAVLELPGGPVLVVDGGPGSSDGYDPGERVILPLLRRRGISRIDLLILSHPHPDHGAGLQALLEALPVGALWTAEAGRPAGAAPAEPLDPSYLRLLAAARRRGVPVERPRPLRLGAVRIEPLGPCLPPPPGEPAGAGCRVGPLPGAGHNDSSLVLRVEYAGRALLLPGDLELRGELRLLEHLDEPARAALRRVDVLKVPHHCSRTSSSESLLRELGPQLAICSLGRRNRYGFPHREVLARYEALAIPLLRTDERGAVTVRVAADGTLAVETVLPP